MEHWGPGLYRALASDPIGLSAKVGHPFELPAKSRNRSELPLAVKY